MFRSMLWQSISHMAARAPVGDLGTVNEENIVDE